ncbi:CAP domain-containing protein [Massilia sp. Se16.2.3]|uniref:CAP domain-containing protein n=1 Tax=Massilia sp. Se16.2.3 TaxID=2709303 RepID=UPI0016012933|nr:CAP domain-containing protein [Massilia sp. Se16.2.3]QNA98654.1 CAP domain-containing protein [Massilia sp. Se16.2.3]
MQHFVSTSLLATALLATGAAHAQGDPGLVALINDYRAHPDACAGRPAPPLRAQATLARVRFGPGAFPESVLEQAGYHAASVEVIGVRGAADAAAAMEAIRKPYCRALLDASFTEVGTSRRGEEWTIVLARPLPPVTLPGQQEVGREILGLVNAARASPRMCGERSFGPAAPVRWNDALAAAALVHSRDMATHRHFAHRGSDGSEVGLRSSRAGYNWRQVGENIAAGQTTPKEAVEGWLDSPGHCANLMNPSFVEMGAGYDISRARMPGFVYWTQVFAVPR